MYFIIPPTFISTILLAIYIHLNYPRIKKQLDSAFPSATILVMNIISFDF